jgi:hypothetical protein
MTIVEFLAYRRYESTRAEANNAMMGLLAGAQLAHLLKLTEARSGYSLRFSHTSSTSAGST